MAENDTTPSNAEESQLHRRGFMVGASSLGAAITLPGTTFVTGRGDVGIDPWIQTDSDSLLPPSAETTRHWLGPELWGNRLQDWQYNQGRIECLRGEAGLEIRTVAALTREIISGDDPGHLRVTTGIVGSDDGEGFCGFLLGTGTTDLDYRAAALTQRSSGIGGGLLCTYETDGHVRFRDHTDEQNPVEYTQLPATVTHEPETEPTRDDRIRLTVDLFPQSETHFAVLLKAVDADTGDLRAAALRENIHEEDLLGGIALVSSPMPGEDGPRWWFEQFQTSGDKIATDSARTFGPIAGTLYSIDTSDAVLKLTAQLLPIGERDPDTIRLRYRPTNTTASWRTKQTTVREGYTALFRIEEWDTSQAWDYQVIYQDESGNEWTYDGQIAADSGTDDELTVALFSCTSATGRRLDGPVPTYNSAGTQLLGRYTPANIYFPYSTLTQNAGAHDPDLLVFVGDQLYERSPTKPLDRDDPNLDYLYKWYLWVWAFRDLTRDTPTINIIDDHDVYQSNLWGSGGEYVSDNEGIHSGGYVTTADFINRVQRIQCGHNPDPYQTTSIERGINTYYGGFTYGGTSFAMLEDRKFKTGPAEEIEDSDELELLGDQQEEFLAAWANRNQASAKICLTQTVFASALTTPVGYLDKSYGTNGYPKSGRDRAIKLLREAGALMLGGDQHLPSLIHHGIEEFTDGIVQFTGPAGGAVWPRWFEPAVPRQNNQGQPYTGDFIDPFGNKFRMLAVENPSPSELEFNQVYDSHYLFDRQLKPEGYGIVRVDYDSNEFLIECWPLSVDPTDPKAEQFSGWPSRLPFNGADER